MASKRILKELKDLQKDPPTSCSAALNLQTERRHSAMNQIMRSRRLIPIPRLSAAAAAASFSSAASPPPGPLKVGDVLRASRLFTAADVARYSAATGDRNPVHLDADFAARVAGFDRRGPVVHGMLVASLIPATIASHFPGAVYASQALHFKLPVFVEDEIVAEMRTTTIREIKKKYYVKWITQCYASDKSLVIDGEAITILPSLTPSK